MAKFRPGRCNSPLPKPEVKTCPLAGCGVTIAQDHWCCHEHWQRFPMRFRLWGNLWRGHWAGDPDYDDFVVKAQRLYEETVALSAEQPEP